jgi:hypothetical protein
MKTVERIGDDKNTSLTTGSQTSKNVSNTFLLLVHILRSFFVGGDPARVHPVTVFSTISPVLFYKLLLIVEFAVLSQPKGVHTTASA